MTTIDFEKLNQEFETQPAEDIVRWAVKTFPTDMAMATSFGAESAGLKDCALSSAALNTLAPWRKAATGGMRKPGWTPPRGGAGG